MPESSPTRRQVLQAAAVVGAAAIAGAQVPATKSAPIVGIQIGAGPLCRGNLDDLLDTLRNRCGMNALFIFAFGHEARFVPIDRRNFRGGNYAIPHMQYYQGSGLAFDDLRAPEFPDVDLLVRTLKATQKHRFKTYVIVEESEGQPPSAPWNAFYEIDFHGRRVRDACSNNPAYRAFTLGLFEDYARSYAVDGFMFSSERQGGLTNALGARHGGAEIDPGKSTCFCNYCTAKAAAQGINVDRAKQGFIALEQFVRNGRSGQKPRDGFFVSLTRLLLNYPELLQWESFWIASRRQLMIDIRNRVKSVSLAMPVGIHVWHNASFSPFYRAEIDFADMTQYADFIKPVLYNRCAGIRMHTFIQSVHQTIFGDIPSAELLHWMYEVLDYQEATYDQIPQSGFSTDYIQREVKRTLDDTAGTNVPIYAGLDIDIPDSHAPYTAESVKESVLAAFGAGAQGVIFARNWGEMNPDHVAGVGDAVRELGFI